MKTTLWACGLWVMLLARAFGQAPATQEPTLAKIARTGNVVLAYSDSSFPFGYRDAQGAPHGYAIDICRRVVDTLSKELKRPLHVDYIVAKGMRRFEALERGEADLECGSTTNTAQRRERVAFSLSHYIAGARMLVRSDSKANSMEDLEGGRIVTTQGTSAVKTLRDRITDRQWRIRVLEAETSPRAFEMVARGEADGFFIDDVLLFALRARSADPAAFKILEKTYTVEPMGLALRRNDPAFKDAVDRVMRRLITSGELSTLYASWFLQRVPGESQPLNLPMNALTLDYFKRPVELSF